MFKIAKWYNNFKAPSVLMIDDLSDAYIDVYEESHKNDWGYLCDSDGSSFNFLQKNLLNNFPYIKITFFVPYLKHNVINNNSKFKFKKYALGERTTYTDFLIKLIMQGHEVAHHGSNHGKYIDEYNPSIANNWIHEWALFRDTDIGYNVTLEGIKRFKNICNIDILGGKYCGYISIENSQEIINKCDFLYWCERDHTSGNFEEGLFGSNKIVSLPTNFPGNSFVRLSYRTGNIKKDKIKKIFKYLQPLYNVLNYIKLYNLYRKGQIISIQEHISPSTTAGTVQSANIISDILSLKKIYIFLNFFSIWYANAKDIAKYIYIRKNSKLEIRGNKLIINFNNTKSISEAIISIINNKPFTIKQNKKRIVSKKKNDSFVVNLLIENGNNIFKINIT